MATFTCCRENGINSAGVVAALHPTTFKPAHVSEEQLQLVTHIVLASETEADDDVYLQRSSRFLQHHFHNFPHVSLLGAPQGRGYSWISSGAAIPLGCSDLRVMGLGQTPRQGKLHLMDTQPQQDHRFPPVAVRFSAKSRGRRSFYNVDTCSH